MLQGNYPHGPVWGHAKATADIMVDVRTSHKPGPVNSEGA